MMIVYKLYFLFTWKTFDIGDKKKLQEQGCFQHRGMKITVQSYNTVMKIDRTRQI